MNVAWRTYSVFGISVYSDFPFSLPLTLSDKPAELTFTCRGHRQIIAPSALPFFTSPLIDRSGRPVLSIYQLDHLQVIVFPQLGSFTINDTHINFFSHPTSDPNQIETQFLSQVLAFWLERTHKIALHASAVVLPLGAVGFLAHSMGGKSTLAASFVKGGYTLLTDDILAIKQQNNVYCGQPGIPLMRLWLDSVSWFSPENLSDQTRPSQRKKTIQIDEGSTSFCRQEQPLKTLYLPQPHSPQDRNDSIQIIPLLPAAALMELVRYSFVPRSMHPLGWQPERLQRLANLLSQVSVKRLIYPRQYSYLSQLRAAILADYIRNP